MRVRVVRPHKRKLDGVVMRVSIRSTILAVAGVTLAACGYDSTSPRSSLEPTATVAQIATRTGFGFNGIASGFLTGKVFLTGGGSFDVSEATNGIPTDSTVRSSGGFRCIEPVAQGPLTNCGQGEGVRHAGGVRHQQRLPDAVGHRGAAGRPRGSGASLAGTAAHDAAGGDSCVVCW